MEASFVPLVISSARQPAENPQPATPTPPPPPPSVLTAQSDIAKQMASSSETPQLTENLGETESTKDMPPREKISNFPDPVEAEPLEQPVLREPVAANSPIEPKQIEEPISEIPSDTIIIPAAQPSENPLREEAPIPTESTNGASQTDNDPLARFCPPPRYPRSAQLEGREGIVKLAVEINTKGRVIAVEVAQTSGHDDLDSRARATVKRWAYDLKANPNANREFYVEINFQLK